jgi:hypothetical protein
MEDDADSDHAAGAEDVEQCATGARERARLAKRQELAAHGRAIELHERATELQERWVIRIGRRPPASMLGTRGSCWS